MPSRSSKGPLRVPVSQPAGLMWISWPLALAVPLGPELIGCERQALW